MTQVRTLRKNKTVLRLLLEEYTIPIANKIESDTVISYLLGDCEETDFRLLKEDFKKQTGHPLIIL